MGCSLAAYSAAPRPVELVREMLQEVYSINPQLRIVGSAATGYGEELVKNAFSMDDGLVETVAHLTAAQKMMPNVDFIIDIGGQDMRSAKARKSMGCSLAAYSAAP